MPNLKHLFNLFRISTVEVASDVRSTIVDRRYLVLILVFMLLILRMATMGFYPLFDTTEARYAEIARKMVELNDWVTPWYADGLAFWAKPPLSFWADAVSFKIFGFNEFSARLAHFLMGVLNLWIVYDWIARRSKDEALYAVSILAGATIFFISTGAVMTDMSLSLSCTIMMRGFWMGLHGSSQEEKNRERWLLFIGAGIGMLAKGPVALVLCGIPMVVYTLMMSKFRAVFNAFPWKYGIALFLIIAVPWYWIAEVHTPGFLNYFFIGEHWHRFVTPGWQGDKFGHAHMFPHGTIWIFTFVGLLPWTLLIPLFAVVHRKALVISDKATGMDKAWVSYLLLWGLTPCVFFTAAANIIWTYELPGVAGFAIWAAYWLNRNFTAKVVQNMLIAGLMITVVGWLVFLGKLDIRGLNEVSTTKALVAEYQSRHTPDQGLLFYLDRPYSAEFYSRGTARRMANIDQLRSEINNSSDYVAINISEYNKLPLAMQKKMLLISRHGSFDLFHIIQ